MSLKQKLIHEFIEVWLVTLYFGLCFSAMLFLKQLVLEQVHIEFSGWGKAWLTALVMAKVLIVLNKTSWGNRLHRLAALWDVSYRSFIYTLVSACVLMAEKLWHARHEHESIATAFSSLIENRDAAKVQASAICLFVAFFGYNLYGELARYLGKERLRRFFFRAAETPPDKKPAKH